MKNKRGKVDEALYQELKNLWYLEAKSVKTVTPRDADCLRMLVRSPYDMGINWELLVECQIDASDWVYPIKKWHSTAGSRGFNHTVDVLRRASNALGAGRLVPTVMRTEGLSDWEHLIKALVYFYKFNEPLESSVRKIRFSTTHRAFGELLRNNHNSVEHTEPVIRAFFRRYKLEHTSVTLRQPTRCYQAH